MSRARTPLDAAAPLLTTLAGLAILVAVEALAPLSAPWRGAIGPELATWLGAPNARVLSLNAPRVLWLLPLALLPGLWLAARRSLVDFGRPQRVAQLLARLALLFALALALAQPSLRAPVQGKTVVLALDRSRSVSEEGRATQRRAVDALLEQMREERAAGLPAPDRTRGRLILYGRDAIARVVPEGWIDAPQDAEAELDAWLADSEASARVDPLGSDHARALRLARSIVDAQTHARVLLLSDLGGGLGERDGLVSALADARRQGGDISVGWLPSPAPPDVWLSDLHLPDPLRVGQSFELQVDLRARGLEATKTELVLEIFQDDAPNGLQPRVEVALDGPLTRVRLPARVSKPGPVRFSARILPASLPAAARSETENDLAAATADVRGRPRILHVGNDPSSALPRALAADHLSVEELGPHEIPATLAELRRFDLVIFSDVPARSVSAERQRAIVDFVRELGGGFIMIGGENSFGVGGWRGSAIERILPVRYSGERQREEPTLALVLVIDKSGSMSSDEKLELVKAAARATARTLDPGDEIGVIAFDSAPQVLVRLQPAANRLRISSAIRRLSAAGGTNALPALREAYLQLAGSKALVKHVILLSDGQSPEGGVASLLSDMRQADITVSAVGVGAGAGKDFLARVAERGRGRYYYSQDGTDVPQIFSREAREVTRNALVERLLYPRVSKSAQALRGVDFSRAPGLRGIVPLKAKPQAEVLLRTDRGDPLLVRGRRGMGRVAAFASDAKPRWAAKWITWSGFAKLWSQIARDTMRQGAGALGGASVQLFPAEEAGSWRVVVDVEAPSGFANDLRGVAEVFDPARPDAPTEELELELSAPGRYEAELREVHAGQRLVRARLYDRDTRDARLAAEASAAVSIPYPSELDPEARNGDPRFRQELARTLELAPSALADAITIEAIRERLSAPLPPPGPEGARERSRALWPLCLLWLALPLLVLDLFLRRVSWGRRRLDGLG